MKKKRDKGNSVFISVFSYSKTVFLDLSTLAQNLVFAIGSKLFAF